MAPCDWHPEQSPQRASLSESDLDAAGGHKAVVRQACPALPFTAGQARGQALSVLLRSRQHHPNSVNLVCFPIPETMKLTFSASLTFDP